jgi:hypothetical protein
VCTGSRSSAIRGHHVSVSNKQQEYNVMTVYIYKEHENCRAGAGRALLAKGVYLKTTFKQDITAMVLQEVLSNGTAMF